MSESFQGINLFGCSVRNITAQFGLNQNPTIYTISVVQEPGQTFRLKNGDIRKIENITVGSLSMNGIIQSFNETQIDVAGTGIFEVRLSDTKTVLEAISVFLHSSAPDVNLGENIITVSPEISRAVQEGVTFDNIKKEVETGVYRYGPNQFKVDMNGLKLTPRGTGIKYRVKGTSMSLAQLIQQISQDNDTEWFVETIRLKGNLFLIKIKTLFRTTKGISLEKLALSNKVIKKNVGKENRNDVNRAVLLGSNRQFLSNSGGIRWRQFWGFDRFGNPLFIPRVIITTHIGQTRTRYTSVDEIRKIINGVIKPEDIGERTLNALRSYGEEFWGRKFVLDINPFFIDIENESWVEPINAAPWEGDGQFGVFNFFFDLPRARDKFITNDGRWSSFIELPHPGFLTFIENGRFFRRSARWDDKVLASPNVIAATNNRFFMKVSIERVKNRLIMTLPTPMMTTAVRTDDTSPAEINDPCVTEAKEDANSNVRNDRRTEIRNSWIAILDKRKVYGPFISEANGLHGRTEVQIDSSIAPWTFSSRDTSNASAIQRMTDVAKAKLRTITTINPEIDTAQLDVTNLPTQNLGTAIRNGTNITNINVQFGIGGVKTSYKAKLFTDELNRQNKRYQDLIDRLTREVQLSRNTLFPEPNYFVLAQESQAAKKGSTEVGLDSNDTASELRRVTNALNKTGVVLHRVGQFGGLYRVAILHPDDVERARESFENLLNSGDGQPPDAVGFVTNVNGVPVPDPIVPIEELTIFNMEERSGRPSRVSAGTFVDVARNCNGGHTFSTSASFTPRSATVALGRVPGFFDASFSRSSRFGNHPEYSVFIVGESIRDPRLTSAEINQLGRVKNIGETKGSFNRLPARTSTISIIGTDQNERPITKITSSERNEYSLNWIELKNGLFEPYLNETPQLFRDPQTTRGI